MFDILNHRCRATITPLLLTLLLLLIPVLPADAHPPVSVVIDSQGNVFYSDLTQVWRIDARGKKTVAVPNVHTHKLWIGPGDVLYGEDVTNVGDDYRHRVWKRMPDGALSHAIDWREGHPVDFDDYGFEFDAAGHMYVLLHAERRIDVFSNPFSKNQARLRSISLEAFDGFIHWHTVHPDGTVFVTVGDALVRMLPGETRGQILAQDLIVRTPAFDFLHDRHALMGMWTDAEQNVYVSAYAGQQAKRVARDGRVTTAFTQSGKWSIAGGTIDGQGRTWLLEFSNNNEARIRRIDGDKETVWE